MAQNDDEFFKQLLATFKIEAEEHISTLVAGLLEFEKDFDSVATPEKLETIYREAHSLKGAARAVNLETIQNICQAFENVLSALKDKKIGPSKELFQVGFEVLDYIKILVQNPQGQLEQPETYNSFIERLTKLCEGKPPEATPQEVAPQKKPPEQQPQPEAKPEQPKAAPPPQQPEATPQEVAPQQKPPEQQPQPEAKPEQPKAAPPPQQSEATPQEVAPQQKPPEQQPKAAPPPDKAPETKEDPNIDKLLKISSQKLDSLIVKVEELLSIKIMYSQLQERISSTHSAIKTAEKLQKHLSNAKQFVRHRLPKNESFYTPLNILFEELALSVNDTLLASTSSLENLQKEISQYRHVVDNVITSLLEDSKKLLMQPFSTILAAFPRMVRDIATQLKKEIDFKIEGESIEIDRRILEEMKDPLMHMVRNSIDHGIETPEVREKAGKPKIGAVKIAITQVGSNHVDMVLSDDGSGFPIEKIKAKALSEGMITSQEATTLSNEDAIKLAFHSGISSSEIITELSGRGLGLSIVVEKIEKLGGSYGIHTENGKGTSFSLSLPLTIATFRGIQILSANQEFIIPAQNIQRILRNDRYELSTVENQKVIFLENKNYHFQHLSDLLGLPQKEEQKPNLVLVIASGPNELAVGVDKIVTEQEVFVKGLGKQLQHVPNISAATIVEDGRIIPILDVVDLIKSSTRTPAKVQPIEDKSAEEKTEKKIVLVVEDTMTTRLLFKNIFEEANYNVLTASDGVEAFEVLMNHHVDLLVTDIQMPRMNGFELVEKVRKEEKIKNIPIIIITARESQEDKKKGIDLGVEAYIEKSSFVQNELISITKKLI